MRTGEGDHCCLDIRSAKRDRWLIPRRRGDQQWKFDCFVETKAARTSGRNSTRAATADGYFVKEGIFAWRPDRDARVGNCGARDEPQARNLNAMMRTLVVCASATTAHSRADNHCAGARWLEAMQGRRSMFSRVVPRSRHPDGSARLPRPNRSRNWSPARSELR